MVGIICLIYWGYQMSVGVILHLLNELNKRILCKPLVSIKVFYLTSTINLVMNIHDFDILFITYPPPFFFHRHAYSDVTSKCYYTSITSSLLNGFITLLQRISYDKNTDIIQLWYYLISVLSHSIIALYFVFKVFGSTFRLIPFFPIAD